MKHLIKKILILMCALFFLIQPAFAEKPAEEEQTIKTSEIPKDNAAATPAELAEAKAEAEKLAMEKATAESAMLFDKGYKAFTKGDYKKAATFFHQYTTRTSRDETEYEWGEFFLGVSLKKCGMTHASVDVLSWLVTRKPNTKIVTYILELFEEITRTIPYDKHSIINRSIYDQEYGFIESELSNFVHYHQGVFDWKNNFDVWGQNHFNKINKKSYYYFKYRYQVALYHIVNNEIDDAIKILEKILEKPFEGKEFKNTVRKTLARLFYEKKEYAKADTLYEEISTNIVYQAQNLLERSWSQYRLNNQEKAMGLLYAFNAPAYRNYFSPEYFLLKSFIYKDVCNYGHALNVIDEFRQHYKTSLNNIYKRDNLSENSELLLALLGKESINRIWKFINLLEEERSRIQGFSSPDLQAYLKNIYALQLDETTTELRLVIDEKYEEIANDLLEYEEKTDLMAYEVSLDMYQRVYQYHYDEENDTKGKEANTGFYRHYYAFYPFQNEFWNDELDNYKVILENKCSSMEEWDIFFK